MCNPRLKKKHHKRLYREQEGICFYCDKPMARYNDTSVHPKKRASLEHLCKQIDGGLWIKSNLVAAHMVCNSNRQDLCPWQHRENKGQSVNFFKEYGICRKYHGENRDGYRRTKPILNASFYDKIFKPLIQEGISDANNI